MTQCTGLPLRFASLGRGKMAVDFQGGDLTSDGGLPLLREVDRKIGLVDALDAAIGDPRCPWLIEHDQRTLLARRSRVTARWRYRRTGLKHRPRLVHEHPEPPTLRRRLEHHRPRRIIAKAEHSGQGENPRFVVANPAGPGQEPHERIYRQRGEAENRIKEQQLGLFADRASCHDFLANQFRVLPSAGVRGNLRPTDPITPNQPRPPQPHTPLRLLAPA